MNNDPWKELVVPGEIARISARRVDADVPWDFFWARGVDGRCLLVLQHADESTPKGHLPGLKGIELSISTAGKDDGKLLVLKLLDSSQKDIFHRLCLDIVEGSKTAVSEREAVAFTIARTWRWHHLLRGGKDERLSPEEQKGLIGELLVLEKHLLPSIDALTAVSAWRGPMGAPKDFEVCRICVEAKARRGAATPFVLISSEHQLDSSGVDELYLHVAELDSAPADRQDGFTITDIAERVRNAVRKADAMAAVVMEDLLHASGFRWEDDYSDHCWIEGTHQLYRVTDDFPRISAHSVMQGITQVKYTISLIACEPFLTDGNALKASIGACHGN